MVKSENQICHKYKVDSQKVYDSLSFLKCYMKQKKKKKKQGKVNYRCIASW